MMKAGWQWIFSLNLGSKQGNRWHKNAWTFRNQESKKAQNHFQVTCTIIVCSSFFLFQFYFTRDWNPSWGNLRATCCKDHLYLCKIEKYRFSENLSGRRFLLTCFKTVTLRLFGFLFSSPHRLLYFARETAKLGPEIAPFAKAGKPKYCAWLEKLTHIIKI